MDLQENTVAPKNRLDRLVGRPRVTQRQAPAYRHRAAGDGAYAKQQCTRLAEKVLPLESRAPEDQGEDQAKQCTRLEEKVIPLESLHPAAVESLLSRAYPRWASAK